MPSCGQVLDISNDFVFLAAYQYCIGTTINYITPYQKLEIFKKQYLYSGNVTVCFNVCTHISKN